MIYELMDRVGFGQEAKTIFSNTYKTLMANDVLVGKMVTAVDSFVLTDEVEFEDILDEISAKLDISRYTINMVFILFVFKSLRHAYYVKGIDDKVYWDTVADIKYKNEECYRLRGVYGNETLEWYRLFAKCKIFSLGRLQFEIKKAPFDVPGFCKEGDNAISVHIPSSGPLLMEDVYDSFNRAFSFFGAREHILFMCSSWLLYPVMADLLPDSSNIKKFQRLWHIAKSGEGMGDFWRVFYRTDPAELDLIEPKSTLERVLYDHIKKGGSMGYGYGFINYSPECEGKINSGVMTK